MNKCIPWTLLLSAAMGTTAFAQPRLVVTSVGTDMTPDGNVVAGLVWDGRIERYVPYTWSRAAGYTRLSGETIGIQGLISCSADAGVLVVEAENQLNWGDLNCFNGYDENGVPNPPVDPCPLTTITHRLAGGVWTNSGSFPRTIDPGTGRWVGGTSCGSVSSPNDLSGDGRYTVGGAWFATPFNQSGGVSYGMCGEYYAFRHDAHTGEFARLSTQPGTTTSRADRTNADGSVITGYDLGPVPDGQGGTYDDRRLSVWVNGVQTLLDPYGNQDSAPTNGAGTIIAAIASAGFMEHTFGAADYFHLVRWTRQGDGTWLAQDLGRLADRPTRPLMILGASAVSADGSTIVGWARFGDFWDAEDRAFIWRQNINGGVPMDLTDYLATVESPTDPVTAGAVYTKATGLSDDGATVLVEFADRRNTCVDPSMSHTTLNTGLLDLNGSTCSAPVISIHPVDTSVTMGTPLGTSFNVFASGTWPMNYRWQREDATQPGVWNDLVESCSNFDTGIPWDFEGVYKSQLRVGESLAGADRAGRYRVIVSNSCGSVTSEPATLAHIRGGCCLPTGFCGIEFPVNCGWSGTYLGDGTDCSVVCVIPCDPDVNCDGVPDQDDVACIILAVAGDMSCFCQADPDFNHDGVPDQGDVADVILTVAGAPCP